jgi:hypothetical protein
MKKAIEYRPDMTNIRFSLNLNTAEGHDSKHNKANLQATIDMPDLTTQLHQASRNQAQ